MKRGIVVFIGILFLVSLVGATITPIKVKTLPWHEVQITAFDADSTGFVSLDKSITTANNYGDVSWNASVDKNFRLVVYIKYRGESITSKKFLDEYEPGEEVYLELVPDGATLIDTPEVEEVVPEEIIDEDETIVEDDVVEVVVGERNVSLFSGYAVLGEGGILSNKIFYYIVGGVVGLIILVVIIFFIVKRKKVPEMKEIRVTKLSELKAQQESNAIQDEELQKAEEELRAAQVKISAIKNKDRIAELQKEIEDKKRELQQLGGMGRESKVEKPQNTAQAKPVWKPEQKQE